MKKSTLYLLIDNHEIQDADFADSLLGYFNIGALSLLLKRFSVHINNPFFMDPWCSEASSVVNIGVQLLYEATLCMWLLSFHDAAVDAFSMSRVLPRLVEVVKSSTKEKVHITAIDFWCRLG